MLTAVLDIFAKIRIQNAQLLVFSSKACHLLVALVDLVHSKSKSVFGLVERFGEIVVAHDFRLGGLVIMQGLALELFGETANFSNILLDADQI